MKKMGKTRKNKPQPKKYSKINRNKEHSGWFGVCEEVGVPILAISSRVWIGILGITLSGYNIPKYLGNNLKYRKPVNLVRFGSPGPMEATDFQNKREKRTRICDESDDVMLLSCHGMTWIDRCG